MIDPNGLFASQEEADAIGANKIGPGARLFLLIATPHVLIGISTQVTSGRPSERQMPGSPGLAMASVSRSPSSKPQMASR
jgi:hypothetical protein